ncbi:PREDICTED: disintegrin and metalloproteinase domain-containing protein 20-like [Miniopterus natalensis]|uniref:disintegrin and metalloproteinase domain-containing protein 20-like n=1 Tax=Miniopterus natalensis TaxID=291302 RepID=UPI0007A6E1E9|nr:PREDICTED: disintegrin and metalloproteinase domain-containing protein 20-like [Miniopterus natalensis]
MGPAWAQAHLTGDLWLPLLWLLLSQVCCFHALPGWRFTSSEIVIPRKVSHRVGGAGVQDQLSYRIHFRGRRLVVHMKVKKNLLPRQFPVITDNDQGAMQEDYPFVPRDCYYYSYLEGVPGSMGTLDTCRGGLRGMLQVDDFTYKIKPLEDSSKFEHHVVSLLVSEEQSAENERCRIEEEDGDLAYEEAMVAENPRAVPVYLWWTHKQYVKIHYTVTSSLYSMSRNITRVIENVVMINNIMHTIYFHHQLVIHIRVICIWQRRDPMDVTRQNAQRIIKQFGSWKFSKFFHEIPHDTSLLLTGHKLSGGIYLSHHDGVCNPNWGVMGVFVARLHIFLAASVSAHALGHGLGMGHDEPGCRCFRRTFCVMAPKPGLFDMFSNCSYARFQFCLSIFPYCLIDKNVPYGNFPYIAPRCGDQIINKREECDCGTFRDCAKDKCCETNCALSLGSQCSGGGCCLNCKPAKPGWICRERSGICDLAEYCDGKTALCPEDVYIQDGTPCSGLAVCVRGNCSDRDMQCQALFGYEVRDGSPACYKQLNAVGDRFGNCGLVNVLYGKRTHKCEPDDVFCGMLHCRNVPEVPGGGDHITFRRLIVKDVQQEVCFGFDLHLGSEEPALGLVIDGATCGPGKFCVEQNCTFHADMGFDCDVKTCNFRGVCNNKKHCHCQRGWNPPGCNQTGPGGSVDSGPAPDREPGVRGKISVNINHALIALFIRTALLLLVLLLGWLTYLTEDDDEGDDKRREDVYIQDGTPCSGFAVCVSGNCSDLDMQRQALFGYEVRDGSPACYQQLNAVGDRFGNCGLVETWVMIVMSRHAISEGCATIRNIVTVNEGGIHQDVTKQDQVGGSVDSGPAPDREPGVRGKLGYSKYDEFSIPPYCKAFT